MSQIYIPGNPNIGPTTPVFTSVTTQTFTTPGAFTYTPSMPGLLLYVIVEMVGGGGGSGGIAATSGVEVASAQSTGSGAYCKFLLTGAQVGASLAGSVGAAGAGGAAGNNNGTGGGNTTLATTSPWTAGGSPGGSGMPASTVTQGSEPGAGGTFVTGTGTNIVSYGGAQSAAAIGVPASFVISGSGGNSFYGGGGGGVTAGQGPSELVAAQTGQGYGSGASSAVNFSSGGSCVAQSGAAGKSGIVIFTEFNNV